MQDTRSDEPHKGGPLHHDPSCHGYIIAIPSLLGVAAAVILCVAAASVKIGDDRENEKVVQEVNAPADPELDALIARARGVAPEPAQPVVEPPSITESAASAAGNVVGGIVVGLFKGVGFVVSIFVGVASLVSGLVGYLLLMMRKVYRCGRCGFILERA